MLIGTPQHNDDAFITFRIARNLAEGHGPYYNPGETVQSSTTPLYLLLLAAGHRLTGLAVDRFEEILEVPLILAVALGLFLLGRSSPFLRAAAFLAPLLLFCHPVQILFSKGMEAFLYAALIVAAAAFEARKSRLWVGVALGLAASVRTEGGLLAASYLAYWFIGQRLYGKASYRWRHLARPAAVGFLVGLPFLAYVVAWYGNPLPNSVLGKIHQALRGWPTFGSLFLKYLFPGRLTAFPPAWGALLILGAAFSAARIRRSGKWPEDDYRAFGFLGVHAVLYGGAFILTRAPDYHWYLFPLQVVLVPFYAATLTALWRLARCECTPDAVTSAAPGPRSPTSGIRDANESPARPARRAPRWLRAFVFAFFAFVAGHWCMEVVFAAFCTRAKAFVYTPDTGYRDVGRYLAETAGRTRWTFASVEIGMLGYESNLPCLDLAGLVSPQCRKVFAKEPAAASVLRFAPEIYVARYYPELDPQSGGYRADVAKAFFAAYRQVRKHATPSMGTVRVFCRNDLPWPPAPRN